MAVEACYIPKTLQEALEIRKKTGAKPLAGGTDLMVQAAKGTGIAPTFPFPVMVISNIKELKGIMVEDKEVVIKALSTPAEISCCDFVPYNVRAAASQMGAVALRNSATIGGNIGNASPKGDLPQPLILLDAKVELASLEGVRTVLLDDFIKGSKKTVLRDDEIITAVRIPEVAYTHLFYHKIGTRRANAISKLSLSCLAFIEDGVVKDFRASTGAAGPKVRRSREAENIIIGLKVDDIADNIGRFTDAWNSILSPHAMPEWRRASTRRMLTYFLEKLSSGAEPGIIV